MSDQIITILCRYIGAPYTTIDNYLSLLPRDIQASVALFLVMEKDVYGEPPIIKVSIAEIKRMTLKSPVYQSTHRHKYFLYSTKQKIPKLNCKIVIHTEIYLPQGEHPTEYYSDVEEDPDPYNKNWDDMDDYPAADTFIQFYPA